MIDPNKKYRTRDGREVRIYAVDGGGEYPVHGAYEFNGRWQCTQWTATGGVHVLVYTTDFDLIEVRPRIKREVWVNVYNGFYDCRESKAEADAVGGNRIACVKLLIDVEEGEGL